MQTAILRAVVIVATITVEAGDAATQSAPSRTQVVLLGTGNPGPTPDRSGPATAIIVNGQPYLVDFGAGVVRRGLTILRFATGRSRGHW